MNSNAFRLVLAGVLALGASSPSLHAQTWDGGGGVDTNWGTAANWSPDAVPTFPTAFTFAGTTGGISNNEATGRTVSGITFNNAAGAFTLTGESITLAGNVGFSANPTSVVTQTINLGIAMGALSRQFSPQPNGNIIVNGLVTGTNGLIRGASIGGSLTLGNDSNSFSGIIDVRGSGLTFATITNKGANSAVGQGAGAGLADFKLGAAADGELVYTGAGSTTDRMIQVGGAGAANQTGGVIITANGTGTLVFTGADFNVAQSGVTSATARALTLRGSNTGDNRISGIIRNNTVGASGTGDVTLIKSGAGKWILEGSNTYSGGTNLADGTLNFTTGGLGTTGAVTFTGNSTLQFGAATTTDLSSRLAISNGVTGTVDTNGNNVTFATGFGASGSGALTKAGTGTLTLSGTNTYTGTTTVSAGTLALNTSGTAALANTSAVVVATGATVSLGAANQINAAASLTLNGGNVSANGFNQTLDTLDLNASSSLSLSGSAALVFANSSALDWNSSTLSVSNFSESTNSLRFGTTSGGLTATQLGLFRFVEFGNSSARIDDDGFIVPLSANYLNSGGTDLVISTAITGTTTVTQSGTGTTTLTGANTSTGLATVTNSILVIGTAAGGNWAGDVTVGSSGILKGRGDIAGHVIVNPVGTYSPGNSPAIQHIGALTVNSGGSVTIELDGPTAGTGSGFHDQVISAGAVTLNGGTLIGQTIFTGSSVPAYVPTLGAVHAVITGSTVTGKFSAYDFTANPTDLSFLPEYTATAVNLYAVPSDYATAVAGLNANQTQVGAALQSLRTAEAFELDQRTTLDARRALFNGLKTQTAAGLRTAYDQLTPEKLTALAATTFQSASILNSSLQQRSAEIRRFGSASISLNGVATPAPEQESTMETVIEDGVHYQIAKAKPKKRYGYFAIATGAFASVDGSADRLGSFSQTGTATAGVDYAINENHSVGLVVSQALAQTDFSSNSGTARAATSRIGVFHDYHNAGFFVNTSVSAGFSAYDSKRKIAFLHQTASGETQGMSYGGQLSTGYDFKVGDFILGPTASVAYDHAYINDFDETGSAADLRVACQNADSLVTKMGFHVSRPFVWQQIGWIPDVSVGASRQSFKPNTIAAQLAAGGDTFKVKPQAAGSEYINLGASLSALLSNDWTVRLSYDAILNPQSAEHRVNLSVGAGF